MNQLIHFSIAFALAGVSVGCGSSTNPPVTDGGRLGSDTGTPPTDGRNPPGDTGAPPTDGGTPPTDGGNPPADGGSSGGWRRLTLPVGPGTEDHSTDRVTGVYCTALDSCAVVTDSGSGSPAGNVYAATDRAVPRVLIAGSTLEATARVLGGPGFVGITRTRNGLVARSFSSLYVHAERDFSNAASWSASYMGRVGSDSFGLNRVQDIQVSAAGRWAMINYRGAVYESTTGPGETGTWTNLWSPTARPSVPADFAARRAADPTLCDSDVSTGIAPSPTQNVYVSQDLALMLHPAGGLNQSGTAAPGVCYSTDGGHTFHHVALPGVGGELGPLAVMCLGNDRCFAFNGLSSDDNSAYVYRTTNASAGAAMTWTRATLPTSLMADVVLNHMFFAPDRMNGWLLGAKRSTSLLLHTTDGGLTWTDQTAGLSGVTAEKLHCGFALDATHIWIGGTNAALLFSDRGGA